jgi:hypothetical protein
MPHPLVLGLFGDSTAAAAGARALRDLGVPAHRVSIVARSHDEQVALARESGASPGSEIEDSAPATRLGELSGHLLAAIAVVMPGIGPIVADGPLAAELGEAAGHLVGGIARTLERAGMAKDGAQDWESRIQRGACLVGAHVEQAAQVPRASEALSGAGAVQTVVGTWVD